MDLLPADEHLQHATLQRQIGKSWELVQAHTQALAAYERAAQQLDAQPPEEAGEHATAWWHNWIQIHIERISIHYFRADTRALQQTVAQLQPELERRGSSQQRARFYQSLLQRNLREERYRSSAETVAYARACLAASEGGEHALDLATARFALGFVLCCHGALAEADEHMTLALDDAERIGHLPLQARCIAYATLILRRMRDLEATRSYALRGRAIAERSGMRDYMGVADANLGWAAWRQGLDEQAAERCEQALAHWQQLPLVYPFQWMAHMPLLALALQQGRLVAARNHATATLQPDQQQLPAELEQLLRDVTESPGNRLADSAARLRDSARRHGLL